MLSLSFPPTLFAKHTKYRVLSQITSNVEQRLRDFGHSFLSCLGVLLKVSDGNEKNAVRMQFRTFRYSVFVEHFSICGLYHLSQL